MKRLFAVFIIIVLVGISLVSAEAQTDALPSWNDGPVKQAIVSFVERATAAGGSHYVPPVKHKIQGG